MIRRGVEGKGGSKVLLTDDGGLAIQVIAGEALVKGVS